jgi:hypothetical protein
MISRRKFIVFSAGAVAGMGLFSALAWRFQLQDHVRVSLQPALDSTAPVGVLTDSELGTMEGLIETLVPGDGDRSVIGYLVAYVSNKAATEAGYLTEYKKAVRILQGGAVSVHGEGSDFHRLSLAERGEILEEVLPKYEAHSRWMRWYKRLFASADEKAFREFVVRDILKQYYKSPAGWAVVGYQFYLGVPRSDYLDYTRPHPGNLE